MQEPVPAILIHLDPFGVFGAASILHCRGSIGRIQMHAEGQVNSQSLRDCSAEDTPFVPIPSPAPWAIEEACMNLYEIASITRLQGFMP